ncbi:hypothetical protein EGW08_016914 [Elysia chlorotica]|uniref:P-type domain-containing protein n=1 Tax=Elysia chlorotica TaxID=188477 RepID=A0A433T193_ELYCH|nr:hypothetical protein EGW08_016914 [Elysia chlorotica]
MTNMSQQKKRHILIAVAIVIGIAVIAAIAIPLALKDQDNHDDDDDNDGSDGVQVQAIMGTQPSDCYPEAQGDPSNVNASACRSRGCKFDAQNSPVCSFDDKSYRLRVTNVTPGPAGLSVSLEQVGSAPFGGDVPNWTFTFEEIEDNIARFTFDAADSSRFRVPKTMRMPSGGASAPNYDIKITDRDRFAFQIIRKETGTVIWASDQVILSDQYLQISTALPSRNVYGLGEQIHETLRHRLTKTWPAFARDQPPSFDDEANLYGVHPFYTCVEDTEGNTHGVLMLNSNAQEYAFSTLPSLTFRTIGGVLDFYLFLGPSPESVIKQYTGVVGRPSIPPYWSLGFQLCRYGYNNLTNLVDAVQSTAKYDIPHDVQYVDIDHMDSQKIFTVDEKNFPGLNSYFEQLREQGMRIIYILDPCLIANQTDYAPYDRLKAVDGFIKWANPKDVDDMDKDATGAVLGYVWPKGKTVFVDFFKEKAREEWKKIIEEYRKTLVFDGLWIERPFNWPEDEKPYWSLKCPKDSLEDPPYRTSELSKYYLNCPLCILYCSPTHNLSPYSKIAHLSFLPLHRAARAATGERSVVISRSTFPGSGEHAGHWLGDNVSQWSDLARSIIGILEFNMFGIPYVGADICGFFGDTTVELCKRWMQLGAFYTFSRNHNTLGAKPQGPGQMGDELGYASRDIMRVRYQLLPYLYLLFHEAHVSGSTVIRPLHHEFPTDQTALSVDRQFLWGRCLLISPILEQGQTELKYYLPQGKWYNYFTYALEASEGGHRTVPVDSDSMPTLHLRGGCAIVRQDHANNTHFSRQKPLNILAALDEKGAATGNFFWDDGVSIDTLSNGEYYHADLVLTNSSLTVRTHVKPNSQDAWTDLSLGTFTVLGVDHTVRSVVLQGTQADQPRDLTFNQTNQVLEIDLGGISIRQYNNFEVKWMP